MLWEIFEAIAARGGEGSTVCEEAVESLSCRNGPKRKPSGSPWHRYDTPIPGWMLPVVWHTEEGLPHKGILACTHARKHGSLRLNWMLRVALAQVKAWCYVHIKNGNYRRGRNIADRPSRTLFAMRRGGLTVHGFCAEATCTSMCRRPGPLPC